MKQSLLTFAIALFFFSCETDAEFIRQEFSVNIPADQITFAAFGDYGVDDANQAAVSALVSDLKPDFVLSMGDNNYPNGDLATIQDNIGKYYCNYIYNYDAENYLQCRGEAHSAALNRFFPTLGNHDYQGVDGALPYLEYFTLPGNERYYEFVWGPVHFYALDSNTDLEEQELWLNQKRANSTQDYNVVFFHHSPYSTGIHHFDKRMRWDFSDFDLVLTGHDHIYQRTRIIGTDRPLYVVNGLGGREKRSCNENPLDLTEVNTYCYDETYGTLLIQADENRMLVEFINIEHQIVDANIIYPQ